MLHCDMVGNLIISELTKSVVSLLCLGCNEPSLQKKSKKKLLVRLSHFVEVEQMRFAFSLKIKIVYRKRLAMLSRSCYIIK